MHSTTVRRLAAALSVASLAACGASMDDTGAPDLDGSRVAETGDASRANDSGLNPIALGPALPTTVLVHVDALRNDRGHLRCTLFANGNGWPSHSDQAFGVVSGDIANGAGDCIFREVPGGTYAAVFAHDENDNNVFDTGIFGIPLEGYGFSNNVHPGLGAPPFSACAFQVDGTPMSVEIHALY